MTQRSPEPSDSDMPTVGIVTFPGVTMLDVSGPAEVFHRAGYGTLLLSPTGGTVPTTGGMSLAETLPMEDPFELDILLVPGSEELVATPLPEGLVEAVARFVPLAQRVASVCTGAFVLAELGLLDGRRATTHWRHAEALARSHPLVMVEPDVIHIGDGPYWTSAGITAGIDLALALVEHDLGAEQARAVARDLVVFLQRPGGQSQFSTALRTPVTSNTQLRRVMDAVLADPASQHGVDTMARTAALSPRQLGRLFRSELGTTPGRWLEEVRLDRAKQLLLDGMPVTVAAQLSGFGSDETLRRTFLRHVQITPRQFRERFATTRTP